VSGLVTELEFYKKFSGTWFQKNDIFYVASESASDFLEYVFKSEVRLFGIDGFILKEEITQQPLEWILDSSDTQPEKDFTLKFITDAIEDKLTHFEFVLDL
jgi:hypothetical protein